MVLNMKETINTVKKMVTANFCGQTNHHIVGISLIIIFMDKVGIGGLMVGNIVAIGNATRCMVRVYSLGQMAENTTDNTLTIRNKDMAYLHGQTDANTMDTG